VTHWQILSKQPEKLEQFYSVLFDWKVSADNPLGYRQVNTGSKEGIHGGIWPIALNEGHSMVQLFIRVEDLGSQVKKVEQLGGRIIVPPQTLPGGDEIAIASDPEGIPFGMFRGSASAPK
jgi:predicted enzyme related to lactoylglutathione lyase